MRILTTLLSLLLASATLGGCAASAKVRVADENKSTTAPKVAAEKSEGQGSADAQTAAAPETETAPEAEGRPGPRLTEARRMPGRSGVARVRHAAHEEDEAARVVADEEEERVVGDELDPSSAGRLPASAMTTAVAAAASVPFSLTRTKPLVEDLADVELLVRVGRIRDGGEVGLAAPEREVHAHGGQAPGPARGRRTA